MSRHDTTQESEIVQTFQRYLIYYNKRMQKPVRVSVVPPKLIETEETEEELPEEPEPLGEIEKDILESVPQR